MNKQVKRVSDCPAERLAQCRGVVEPAGEESDEVIKELKMMADMCSDNEDPEDQLMYMRWLARIRRGDANVTRLTAEREALQQLLNVADQSVNDMIILLNLAENILGEHPQISPGYDWINNTQQDREEMRKQIAEYLTNMKAPAAEVGQFPQSCTTMCGCNQGRLPCACQPTPTAYDGFDNGVD